MTNTVILKRGQKSNIANLTLEEGELALVYNATKTSIELYSGDGNGGLILINPDVTQTLKDYTDTKIGELVNGAPEAMDTLAELATAISNNSDLMDALNEAIGNKANSADVDDALADKLDVNGDASNVTTSFTQATTRTNLTTGEKLSITLGKIKKFFADLASVAFSGSYTDLSDTPVVPVYATCSTSSSTTAKVATTTNDFVLTAGATVRVKFTYTNSTSAPTLNVNDTGAIAIKQYNTTSPLTYSWYAGSVVEFTYDGTYWLMSSKEVASTTYAGVVKLSSSRTSSSTTVAANSYAVYLVNNALSTEITDRINADTALQEQIDTKLDGDSVIDCGEW